MQRTTILLLFGGESSEHEVSISSARNVFAALDDTKYDIVLCYIDKTGKWWLMDSLSEQISTRGAHRLMPVLGSNSFMTVPSDRIITVDVILPILHGSNGEDGTVQGLARLLHIPIAGSGVLGSAITMDKVITKQLLEKNDVPVVPYVIHYNGETAPDYNQLTMTLGTPLFVKPANGGSSIGVSKVYSEQELIRALVDAHRYDRKVLIERGLSARELEVAVLGHPHKVRLSGVGEIEPEGDFYSYDSKYNSESTTKVIIPADLSEDMVENIKTLAQRAYMVLECDGLARIDFFLSDENILYLNEVNALPGFTNISMYPKLWRQQGLSYMALLDTLIEVAIDPDATIHLEN